MAVHGYRKTHAQLTAQGWNPREAGRDRVTSIMRELGIRGARRGRTPVTTQPAKGTDGLAHHADHGVRYTGLVCTTRVMEYGMPPSTGTVGDSYDNAMAENADGAYKTELVWRRKPFRDLRDLELATFRWVSWRGLEAAAPVLGLQDTGTERNRVLCKPSGASRPTIRAEQKSGHINARPCLASRWSRCAPSGRRPR